MKRRILTMLSIAAISFGMLVVPTFADVQTRADKPVIRKAATEKVVKYNASTRNYFSDINGALGSGGKRVVIEPGHTYHIDGMLRVPSNSTIVAKGATIIEDRDGCTLMSQPDERTNKKSIRGYNAVKNIKIIGGTWIGTRRPRADAAKKEGFKMGANTINFLHSKNITFENVTVYNAYNAHLVELTGCKNVIFKNCRIGLKKNGKPGAYHGSSNNGAIQLDACYTSSNNPRGAAFDGTACRDIKFYNCCFHYPTAIECAQRTRQLTRNVLVKGCRIEYRYTPFIHRNTVNFKASKNKLKRY